MLGKLILRGSVSKASDWDCQDAWAEGPSRAAVADGVTNSSYMSRHFAQRVVDCFVEPCISLEVPGEVQDLRSPNFSAAALGPGALPEFAASVRRLWRKDVDEVYLPFASLHQRTGWTGGGLASYATFAGVEWQSLPDDKCVLSCFVVGDCFAFIGREDEEVRIITGAEPGETSLTQALCVSVSDDLPFFSQLHALAVVIENPDTWVMLTTDFIGRQLSREILPGAAPWPPRLKSLVQVRNQSDLLRWVRQNALPLADGGADDAAVILLKFEQQAQTHDESGATPLIALSEMLAPQVTPEVLATPLPDTDQPGLEPEQLEPEHCEDTYVEPAQADQALVNPAEPPPSLALAVTRPAGLRIRYRPMHLLVATTIFLIALGGIFLVWVTLPFVTPSPATRTASTKFPSFSPAIKAEPEVPNFPLTPEMAWERVSDCVRAMVQNGAARGISITPNQRKATQDGQIAPSLWADLYIAYKKPGQTDPLSGTLKAIAEKKVDSGTLIRLALTPCPAGNQ
jgi:hypothetical protein